MRSVPRRSRLLVPKLIYIWAVSVLNEEQFRADLKRAESAWPDLSLAPEQFERFMEARRPLEGEVLCWEDLYLACSCLAGSKPALELLDVRIRAALPAVRRVDASAAFAEEVLQTLRERLLMSTPQRGAKLLEYSGRGSMRAWLRTVAVRVALNMRPPHPPTESIEADEALAELSSSEDFELELIKAQFRAEFKAAFQLAFRELDARERTLLRLNILDGLNIAQIGALYGTHRATVARWIAAAREALNAKTRAALARSQNLPASELDSMLRLAQSQLEVSLEALLCQVP